MSSSDSNGPRDSKDKTFLIGKNGTPVNWYGEHWSFYKNGMMVTFQEILLHKVMTGDITVTDAWSQKQKDEFTKKQVKI